MLLLAAIQYLGPLLSPDRTVSLQRLVQAGLSAALVYWFLGRILRARSPRVALDYESGEALEDLRDDLHDQTGQRQSIAMLINTIISSIDYMDLTISRELPRLVGSLCGYLSQPMIT